MIRFLYECAIEKLRALLLHRDANVLQAVAVACERLLQTEVAMLGNITHTIITYP